MGYMGRVAHRATLIALLALTGCSARLFQTQSNPLPSKRTPLVRIETRTGVEYGAATDHGILFLGRTAQKGPCRVHYYLGDQMFVEDGMIRHRGSVLYEAEIDLKHQRIPLLDRDVLFEDELLALTLEGYDTVEHPVHLVRELGIDGDVVTAPGAAIPAGTPLVIRRGPDDDFVLAGLIAGAATLEVAADTESRVLVFAGPARFREMLLVPEPDPKPRRAKHRPDGITVVK